MLEAIAVTEVRWYRTVGDGLPAARCLTRQRAA
jgi:hypothetical protein